MVLNEILFHFHWGADGGMGALGWLAMVLMMVFWIALVVLVVTAIYWVVKNALQEGGVSARSRFCARGTHVGGRRGGVPRTDGESGEMRAAETPQAVEEEARVP